ncbi:mucin-5AC-like isoform X1 [Eriocheir sinensis]|uniref:mucin-5AC-like isoform X1 n=1 Tax=Eriocheir sinensis TaxID=95602 RepID=UPI0021C6358B|nr:mucin-5AC-like isoform X1 [Eriocheir sinensis]
MDSRHLFFTLMCWCLWSGAWASLPFRVKEYMGSLDTCRCVPLELYCDEEVVAFSYLSSFTHSVKVCAGGTRLCCRAAPPSTKSPTKSQKEGSYFLLLKVPPTNPQGLSRNLLLDPEVVTSEDNEASVIEYQEGNGTAAAYMEDVESLEASNSSNVTGNTSVSWVKENDGGEGEGTESSPEVTGDATDSTMFMNSNVTEENFTTLSTPPTHSSTGEGNRTATTLRNMLNASVVTSLPSPDFGGCFLDACHGNSTSTLHMSTSKEPRNTSLENEERSRIEKDTLNTSSIANISSTQSHSTDDTGTDFPAPQDQIAVSSSKLGHMTSSSSSPPTPPPAVGIPLTPTPKPRPPSTTTPTPSFWVWLFG